MSWLFLALSVVSLGLAALGVWGHKVPGPWWAPAMAVAELAPWFLVAQGGMVAGFAAFGWIGGSVGSFGLATSAVAAVLLAIAVARSLSARPSIESGLGDLLGETVRLPRTRMRTLVRPGRALTDGLEASTHSYGPHRRHLVDRITARGARLPAPVLIHIHGGGWWRGDRGTQARPLLRRMAAAGWVVLTPSYRLSPEATFPDHLRDIERLLEWVRANQAELGADAGFIAVAGGSSGGHLAALAGMPADGGAAIQVSIPIYGVHDLLGRDGASAKWPYLESQVMKSDPRSSREQWLDASPIHRAAWARSPFLVVHGAEDSLVNASDSRRLVAALREAGVVAVGHIEVPWANHGFDHFASIRGTQLANGIGLALERLYEKSRSLGA